MQLRSFKAQGFKNFRNPVALDGLGPINVIHGPNNVGKSNLLQAIQLFFFLIGQRHNTGIPIQSIIEFSDEKLVENGFPRNEIFNLEEPAPIVLEAEVAIGPTDFERAGLTSLTLPLDRLRVELELRRMGTHTAYTVRRFEAADRKDFAAVTTTRSLAENAELSAVAALLSLHLRTTADATSRFALVPAERYVIPELTLALYDIKESPDIEISRRWHRFMVGMAAFQDILGEGTFVATYDRKAGRANLFYETPRARIPLQLLGSGVQQLASLLGMLLVTGATIAGIEEPEMNLRYTLALRLREVLTELVGTPGGVDQLFLTSHSDAFEAGSHFYYMEATPDGPRVEKHPAEEARAALGMTTESAPPDTDATLCYLSTDGVVRVPERIRRAIGLPNGGGVVFLEHDGAAEIKSDAAITARFEPKRGGEGDEQP